MVDSSGVQGCIIILDQIERPEAVKSNGIGQTWCRKRADRVACIKMVG